ncbi:MAG: hypothetical protein ACRC3Z_11130 [Phocaeicola sp.]
MILAAIFFFFLLTLLFTHRIDVKKGDYTKLYNLKSFSIGISWLIPIIGFLGYVLIYSKLWDLPNNSNTREIVIKICDVLLIGGVVGFLSNAAHFFGIFKKELEGIVLSTEFIEKRNDISDIWRNTSKALFEQRFPDISDELLEIIENYYICKEEYSYYRNYRIITDVTWADDTQTNVIVKDYICFDFVTEKIGENEILLSTWINGVTNLTKGDDYYCNLNLKIDNKGVECENKEYWSDDKSQYSICYSTTIDNKEKNEYQIVVERERKYNFDSDYDISFRAKYIVKDMAVSLNLPEGIEAYLMSRGTTKDFIKVKDDTMTKEYIYKGLLLQKQGYIFALKRTNIKNQGDMKKHLHGDNEG